MQLLKSVLKSLLFAMLLSGAASEKPRLRGTSSERAAVSNQFNPGPRIRDRERHEPSSFVPAASRAMNQNPDPDSTTRKFMPSPQGRIVKMPQAVYGIWPILLLWSPHGPRMLQVE